GGPHVCGGGGRKGVCAPDKKKTPQKKHKKQKERKLFLAFWVLWGELWPPPLAQCDRHAPLRCYAQRRDRNRHIHIYDFGLRERRIVVMQYQQFPPSVRQKPGRVDATCNCAAIGIHEERPRRCWRPEDKVAGI